MFTKTLLFLALYSVALVSATPVAQASEPAPSCIPPGVPGLGQACMSLLCLSFSISASRADQPLFYYLLGGFIWGTVSFLHITWNFMYCMCSTSDVHLPFWRRRRI